MSELFGAKVEYKEAKILADLTLVLQDLTFTVDILKRLIKLLKDDSKDNILIQSYWTASLISYVRCFSAGKRLGLSEDIFKNTKLEDDPLGCHHYFKNLRDKHIAHSVNPFEQIVVDLQLSNPKSKKREVLGVSILSQKLICTTVEGAETFLRLALIAREEVRKQAKEYENKTLEVGKKLPIDVLYSKGRSRIITPGPEDTAKAR